MTFVIDEQEGEVAVGDDGFEGTLTDIGNPVMLRDKDAEEVVNVVVRHDAVEVVDLVVERDSLTAPGEIDGMRDEDVLVFTKSMFKLQIPLFTIRVG